MSKQNTTPASAQDPLAFVAGGGEMGRLIRTFDWSQNPLGPLKDWPQSLKTAVSICLSSRFPIPLWWGPDLRLIYNDAWRPVLGQSKHPQALGSSGREVWPEIWHIIGPMLEGVLATGQATWSDDQLLMLDRNGYLEEAYFTYSYSPIRDESGTVVGVFSAVNETTLRVVGERRLRTQRELAAQAATAKSPHEAGRAALQTFAANPADVPFALLYFVDDDQKHARLCGCSRMPEGTAASPKVVDLTVGNEEAGWSLAEVVRSGRGRVVGDLSSRFGPLPRGPFPVDPQQAIVMPLRSAAQDRVAGVLVMGVNPCRELGDEHRSFFDLVASHVATAIANAHAYEEERRRAEALAELDRAKTAFFSNVSHEFRTPLTLMLGPVEDILAKPADQVLPDNRNLLEVVNRNGLRLLRLVNSLLDFSRIEAGRVRAVYQPTDLATFTADLASNFRSACEKAGLRLVVSCPPLGELVLVDREMWEKVVLNLVSNAFKFTFEGEIAVSLRRAGTAAELRVRDTGTGIPAEEMPKLFERFHRVQNARGRSHEGSGIGLALTQELVKLHGGSVTAESSVGEGTTFIVSVPLGSAHLPADRIRDDRTAASTGTGALPYVEEALRWLPDARRDEAPSELPTHHGLERDGEDNRCRVLVADDNADMRQYIVRLLAEQFRVEAVPDGEAALAAARDRPPDLILSDVMMPKLNGFGLLEELRADPRTSGLPVILLSARAGEESRVEGMEAGADDYLVKPFSARELLARVTAHLKMAQLRREANESVRRSEERFRAFMNHSPTTAYIKDEEGRYVFVNRLLEQVFRRPRAEWVGKTDLDIFAPEEAEQFRANDRNVLNSRTTGEFVETATQEDGLHYYLSFKFPIEEADGRLLLAGMSVDITEQKRTEERLASELEATTRLHALSSRLLSATGLTTALDDVLENAILTCGADFGNIQLFNPQIKALEIVAQRGFRPDFLDYFRTVRVDEGSACAQAMQSGERIIIEDVELDPTYTPHRQIAASAGYRAVASTPLKGHDGTIVGMLSIHFRSPHRVSERDERLLDLYARHAADLIERLRLMEALRQLAAELSEANHKKDEFLATLAHELRNPLAPIRNALTIIRLSPDREAREHARSMMERQLGQMVRLVDDLMDVSRISRGKVELRKERVLLSAVLSSAVETSRPLIEQMGHDLTIRLTKHPVVVDADPTRLAQVFMNLLNNAAKYSERGGRITLTAERQGSDVVVSVKDTGIGIPTDKLTSIFDMFSQVDRSLEKAQGGLGIGLTLVKRLVEMHGGSVEAHSEGPGRGSELVVRLPVVVEASGPQQEQDEPAAPKSSLRILIVDDNRDGADSLAMMLRLMGNETATAYDGQEGLEVAQRLRPDVVLLDIGLPKLNGYEACRRIRKQPWGKNVVLIAVTGWGQEEDRRRSHDAGFDQHMVKPVDPNALTKLLVELQAVKG